MFQNAVKENIIISVVIKDLWNSLCFVMWDYLKWKQLFAESISSTNEKREVFISDKNFVLHPHFRAVKFSAKLMGKALAKRIKCTILYATETGKSETFAKRLCQIFKHAFDAKVIEMFFSYHCLMWILVYFSFGKKWSCALVYISSKTWSNTRKEYQTLKVFKKKPSELCVV